MKLALGRRRLIFPAALVVLAILAVATGLVFRKGTEAAPNAADAATQTASTTTSDAGPKDSGKADPGGPEDPNVPKKAPIPVSVESVVTGTVSSYITSTANLIAENDVKILAEAEGRVAALKVEEGDRVARGQVLAELVRDDAEIAFRKAEVRATNARLQFERAAKVFQQELMSREDYERLTMENDVAGQELAEARWRLDKTTIRAPISGRITERTLKLGQHVRPGDVLFGAADFDPLIAQIYLPEREILGLSAGREVRITMKANEAETFPGRIRQISPVVDTATGTVKVTVEATRPPDTVRPGSFVTIDIVRESRPGAVLLPREAVVRELKDAYVFVANGATAEKRPVSLGIEEGGRIEAIRGVKAGERVIVEGQGGLKDGSAVTVVATDTPADRSARHERPARG